MSPGYVRGVLIMTWIPGWSPSSSSRRRVQQLVREYRDSGEIPQLETPGRKLYILRVRDDRSIDNNRVHAILEETEHVSENPNKQGRRRPLHPDTNELPSAVPVCRYQGFSRPNREQSW